MNDRVQCYSVSAGFGPGLSISMRALGTETQIMLFTSSHNIGLINRADKRQHWSRSLVVQKII